MKLKRTRIILMFLVVVIPISVYLIFMMINNNNGKNVIASQYSIDNRDWALYNYGQIINDSVGISGVDINIVEAWKICEDSDEVIVGLVDTGVDYECETLKGHLWENEEDQSDDFMDNDGNGFIDDYYGWDFYNNDNTIYDNYLYDYHGTYIANTIAIVAPEVKILVSKFLKGTKGDVKDGIRAIEYAIDNGATIINCSWCFEVPNEKLSELIQANEDVLFVCAAGNSRINLDEDKVYPASYNFDNVISVLSIDNTGEIYDYSGYGVSVDIAAPGKDIYVTMPEGDKTCVDGTSISTAYVTAAAALLKSINRELSPLEMKDIILATSQELGSLNGKCKSNGCLDVYSAIARCIEQN